MQIEFGIKRPYVVYGRLYGSGGDDDVHVEGGCGWPVGRLAKYIYKTCIHTIEGGMMDDKC